jgi:anion transporter
MSATVLEPMTRGKFLGLSAAVMAMAAVMFMPAPAGLPVAGQRMLGILAFAVIIWMSEAVNYSISSALIMVLVALGLGFAPDLANPKILMGTNKALGLALSGFSNTAFALVGGAMFISAAMMITGLDKRLALLILSKVGARTNRILAGVILVGFILSFFVPSTTARVSCMVPIVMGIIVAFGVSVKSRFAAVLMIATAQADSIWNVGIKTAAAQNMIAVNFIEKQLGHSITWLEWFLAAAPFALVMSVVLYFILLKMLPPEVKEIPGGHEAIERELNKLGPMSASEKKLMFISMGLLFFWSTEKVLHDLDTSTTTLAAIALMLMPGVGVMCWKEAQAKVAWGTVVLFGVGISLGQVLLTTKAADWLAQYIVSAFGLQAMSSLGIIAVLSAFLIVIHLGFASATGLSAAMIPIVISVFQALKTPGLNMVGMTMVIQYVICFGFILPVNAPQNMVAYSTETFEAKDFIRTGIPITLAAYAGIILMSMTYWNWIGLVR